MKTGRARPLLITLSIIAIILIAVLVLGIYNIRLKNKETSELLQLVDQASEKDILSQSIRIMQNTAAQDISAFNDLLLTDEKLVPLIEDIEGKGKSLNLDVDIASVGKKEGDGIGPDTVRMVIVGKGSWSGMASFLSVLENLPHRVLVEEYSVSKEGAVWNSRITMSLYLFK